MVYKPSRTGDFKDVAELARFVEDELRSIERSQLDDIIALELRTTHQEPRRPRQGMLVYADGSAWNPGSGEGVYTYASSGWGRLIQEIDGSIAIGPFPINSTIGIFYTGTITGQADAAAFQLSPTFTATNVAGPMYGIAVAPFVASGAATISTLVTTRIESWGVGAGVTVGSAIGLYVNEQTVGTTNRSIYVAGGISEFDGQLIAKGTSTNDDAAVGDIGEFVSTSLPHASAINLATGAVADVMQISITAGDWDVCGDVWFLPVATSVANLFAGWISAVASTFPSTPTASNSLAMLNVDFGAGRIPILSLSAARISVAATTTVYLGAYCQFTAGTMQAHGKLRARRVR